MQGKRDDERGMEAVLFKKDQKESVPCESETELGTTDKEK